MPRRTALIVPVPEAAAYYRPGNGVPAHATILFPFLEPGAIDEEALATLFAPFPAFDFTSTGSSASRTARRGCIPRRPRGSST